MRWFMVIIFALLPLTTVEAAIRIGYVDLRKALNEVEDGRYAKRKLLKKKKKFQKELGSAQKKLKKAQKRYKALAKILKGRAREKARFKLQREYFQVQRLYTKRTRELARSEAVETRKIFAKMQMIIKKIAQENGLILMLEKSESSVLYAKAQMNYTSELIRRYDRLFGNKKKKRRRKRRRRRRRRKRR